MRLLHEIAIFQTVKSKVIISLFETVRLSVSISLRNRGYLTFSVKDRYLFHRMNNKSSIFTSGEATSENTAFGVHE